MSSAAFTLSAFGDEITDDPRGQEVLKAFSKTQKFDVPDKGIDPYLTGIRDLMKSIEKEF